MANYTRAVFSDIHANADALSAVLADITAHDARGLVCLGDVVGYGAEPAECLETVRKLRCPIMRGNHDQAVASEDALLGMRGGAQLGVLYAREKLAPEQRAFLAGLPFTREEPTCQFVHGSLEDPASWTYVLSAWDALAHFAQQTQRLCFCGHTHLPMLWHLAPDGSLTSTPGAGRIRLPGEGKVLVNVGSVGQPRDEQPTACYVLYHTHADEIEFRRVPYDAYAARRKIIQADLPKHSGDRLLLGR